MRFFITVFIFTLSLDSFGFMKISSRDALACKQASQLLDMSLNTKLEEAYYLRHVIFCSRLDENKHFTNSEWLSSGYFIRNMSIVNSLIIEADYSIEKVGLIDELTGQFFVSPEANEIIRLGLLESLAKDSSYYDSDEHPYEENKVIEENYFAIAIAYYDSGMNEDGHRVLNELRQLPYQYLPNIDATQIRGEQIYEKWVTKQSELVEKSEQQVSKTKGRKQKTVDVTVTEEAELSPIRIQSDNFNADSFVIEVVVFICIFISIFGFLIFRRKKNKK